MIDPTREVLWSLYEAASVDVARAKVALDKAVELHALAHKALGQEEPEPKEAGR